MADELIGVTSDVSAETMMHRSTARSMRMVLSRRRQEQVIGRRKDTGAPLSGGTEFTPFDLDKQNPDGSLAIGPAAHVRQASPQVQRGRHHPPQCFS